MPQVYVGAPAAPPVPMAVRALAGFERVSLDPGQTKHVTIELAPRAFQYWSVVEHAWNTAWGDRRIAVGSSSRDLRLTTTDAPLKPAAEEVLDLLALVQGAGPGNSLNAKAKAIQAAIAAGRDADACAQIAALQHEVSAQTGKKLSSSTAAALQREAGQGRRLDRLLITGAFRREGPHSPSVVAPPRVSIRTDGSDSDAGETRCEAMRERALFRCATAVLGLHASVDSFVAPEPGTAAADHAVRGSVSLALIAAAAFAYPRVRPGARAAIACVLGVLALEGAALAVADARAVGARGEDWSGLLLLPVGLALCTLAGRLLWRSRKPGRFRHLRRVSLAVGGIVLVLWIVLPIAVAILATHRPRATVQPARLGRPYQEVSLRTRDGLDLAAWYVPSRNGAAVVSYPTRAGSSRRHGCSRGTATASSSWTRAVTTAATAMRISSAGTAPPTSTRPSRGSRAARRRRRSGRRHRLLGRRRGDAAGRRFEPRPARGRLRRCGCTLGPREPDPRPARLARDPADAVQTTALAAFTGTKPPPSLERLVARIAPRPLFLIYAGRGAGGEDLNPDYYSGASSPKSLWKIPKPATSAASRRDRASTSGASSGSSTKRCSRGTEPHASTWSRQEWRGS